MWQRTRIPRRHVDTVGRAILMSRAYKVAPSLARTVELLAVSSPIVRRVRLLHHLYERCYEKQGLSSFFKAAVHFADGFLPAVILARTVQGVGWLVIRRCRKLRAIAEQTQGDAVRAIQVGLTSVPIVDPNLPRSSEEYLAMYQEWMLHLKHRLQQDEVELSPTVFDESGRELMRFALSAGLPYSRSVRSSWLVMDRTLRAVKGFNLWYQSYPFLRGEELEQYSHVAWWEGPDDEHYAWLMIDNQNATDVARRHGAEFACRVLVSILESGVRDVVLPLCECQEKICCVVDFSGVNMLQALQFQAVYRRLATTVNHMYPQRLKVLYAVGLPPSLQFILRGILPLLHQETRRKVVVVRQAGVPRQVRYSARSRWAAAHPLDAEPVVRRHWGQRTRRGSRVVVTSSARAQKPHARVVLVLLVAVSLLLFMVASFGAYLWYMGPAVGDWRTFLYGLLHLAEELIRDGFDWVTHVRMRREVPAGDTASF